MYAQNLLAAHPSPSGLDVGTLTECIEACFACAQACTACADACLAEQDPAGLAPCIRTDLDCADVCQATGRVLSRQTQPAWDLVRAQVGTCLRACQLCGKACRRHAAEHGHCKVCGDACRRCEKACDALLNALKHMAVSDA